MAVFSSKTIAIATSWVSKNTGHKEPSVTRFMVSASLRKEDRKANLLGGRWIASPVCRLAVTTPCCACVGMGGARRYTLSWLSSLQTRHGGSFASLPTDGLANGPIAQRRPSESRISSQGYTQQRAVSIVTMLNEVTASSSRGEFELTFQVELGKMRRYLQGEINVWAEFLGP